VSIKGSWSRVRDHDAYAKTLDRIRRNERRRKQLESAAEARRELANRVLVIRKGDPLL